MIINNYLALKTKQKLQKVHFFFTRDGNITFYHLGYQIFLQHTIEFMYACYIYSFFFTGSEFVWRRVAESGPGIVPG